MRQVAQEMGFPESGRHPLPGAQAYYDILTACGCEVDIWRTTYYHPLESHQAIIDWLQSTGFAPTCNRSMPGSRRDFSNAIWRCCSNTIRYSVTERSCCSHDCLSSRSATSPLMTETSGEIATQCAIAGRQRRFCRCNDRFLALRVFFFSH
jgi:hypothetical protein